MAISKSARSASKERTKKGARGQAAKLKSSTRARERGTARDQFLTYFVIGRVTDDEFGVLADFDPTRDYLTPANGSSVTLTIRLTYQDGRPAPGVAVAASCRAETLTGANWRTVEGLVSRWPANSAQRLRERIQQGLVRLGGRLDRTSATTNANGEAAFKIDAWHVCGNEGACGSDRVTLSWQGGAQAIVLRCGMAGLVAIPDEPSNGLRVAAGDYFVQAPLIGVLRAIGQAWRDTPGKPPGMPHHFTVTDGSIHWGGLKPPHLTHRFGGAIDARPISTNGQPTSIGAPNYSREGTTILVDYFHQTGAKEIRFGENLPHVTAVDTSHRDHLHVSWLQNPAEPWALPPTISHLVLRSTTFGEEAHEG